MYRADYHIHVNHFADAPPDCLSVLSTQGFKVTPASLVQPFEKSGLWLIAKKVCSAAERDSVYSSALAIVRADPTFRGYVESESAAFDYVCQFKSDAAFRPLEPFPIEKIVHASKEKVADIHVYRCRAERDRLDELFEASGFYLVETDRKKIWTLLIAEIKHAGQLYKRLASYFATTGGVQELELEIINAMELVPKTYNLPALITPVRFSMQADFKDFTLLQPQLVLH